MAMTAIPTAPPRLRIRLKRLVAFPMPSRGTRPMEIVVSGTKINPSENPWMNCGQNKSQ